MGSSATTLKPSTRERLFSVWLGKALVAAYRWLGFLILTCILVGLVSYIGVHLFYFAYRSWVTPTIISPTDPAVLDLAARVAHETSQRQQVEASRADLEARIALDERVERVELSYQESLRTALAEDAAVRRSTQMQLASVDKLYREAREQLEASSREHGEVAKQRALEEFSAKLIDRDTFAARTQKLAELMRSNITLSDRQNEIAARVTGLGRESAVLGRLASSPSFAAAGKSLEGVEIAKQFSHSVLTVENARADREAARRSLAALDSARAHYDSLLKTLESSALLRAVHNGLDLAFVPYANRAEPGSSVYACRFGLVFCRRVGRVKALLEGEVVSKHPVYGSELRGRYAELEIEDAGAMQSAVLHCGRPPLFF